MSDRALRRCAVGMFGLLVLLTVVGIALAPPLRGLAGRDEPDSEPIDIGYAINLVVLVAVGLVLTTARPRNAVGWLMGLAGLCGAACNAGQVYGTRAILRPEDGLPLGGLVMALTTPLWVPSLFIPVTLLLARYPSGRISGRWPRRFDRAAVAGLVLLYVGYAASPTTVTDEIPGGHSPLDVPAIAWLALVGLVLTATAAVATVAHTVVRLWRARYPERQQLVLLFTTATVGFAVVYAGPLEWLGSLAYGSISVAVAVGVLKYNLLGIDLVLRRTLLYGALTALVIAVFVGVTAALTALIPGPAPTVVAASLVAVGLAPARDRLQDLVDRFVYGARNDPWAALSALSTPLHGMVEDPLPGVTDALRAALRVDAVAIRGRDGALVAGDVPEHALEVPLRFGGTELGTLAVAPRKGEDALAAGDRRLLEAVAPLVATVVHAVRLAGDLADARARVLGATEAERQRLRQDLHDGLGPSLTGIGLGLEALESTNGRTEMTARLRSEVANSLEEVRRIIDDLRPGALTDRSLLDALQERVDHLNATTDLAVTLEAPDTLEAAPEVEVTALRIADEALTNVLRHAAASTCRVTVTADGTLTLSVADDGVGINGHGRDGVGLRSMRERAIRLGGTFETVSRSPGTEVLVTLPLEAR